MELSVFCVGEVLLWGGELDWMGEELNFSRQTQETAGVFDVLIVEG